MDIFVKGKFEDLTWKIILIDAVMQVIFGSVLRILRKLFKKMCLGIVCEI